MFGGIEFPLVSDFSYIQSFYKISRLNVKDMPHPQEWACFYDATKRLVTENFGERIFLFPNILSF